MLSLRNISITYRIGGSIVLLSVVLLVSVVWTLLNVMSGLIADAERAELDGHYQAVMQAIEAETYRAASMATLVAVMPVSVEGMATSNRETLAAAFGPSFKVLGDKTNGMGVEQFQFHTPPATAFFRVHSPKKFGDDLSSFRATVVEANKTKKTVTGMEIGVAGLGIRAVVPVVGDRHLGTVEFGLSIGKSFLERLKKIYGVELALFVSKEGQLVPFASTIENGAALTAPEGLAAALGGKPQITAAVLGGIRRAVYAAPVADYSGKPFGVIEVVMDASQHDAQLRHALRIAILVGGVGLLLGLALTTLIHLAAVKPVVRMTAVMRRLASDDFSVEVPSSTGTNEVSAMADALAVFKERALDRERMKVEQEEHRLHQKAEQRAAMLRLADELENKVKSLVTQVQGSTDDILSSAETMGQRLDSGTSRSLEAVAAAEGASDKIAEVAEASGAVVSGMREVSGGVQRAAGAARKAAADADTATDRVQQLDDAARRIGEVVKLINDIASQTNLLALNATIEAARAGDAGKGFAVVANEVKVLANQTSKATGDIAAQVQAIQNAIADTVAAMAQISEAIRETNDTAQDIVSIVERQESATHHIMQQVQDVSQNARTVNENLSTIGQTSATSFSSAIRVLWSAHDIQKPTGTLSREVNDFLENIRKTE
ncbi:MAG: methyl-accepting chemotaxis protein [Alphaproteobacteria bacterium]